MKFVICFLVFLGVSNCNAQSCQELMEYVKRNDHGSTYTNYKSSAISKVTFYEVSIDYEILYFAIVCFKENQYSFSCSEYIYQVASNTKFKYSVDYLTSAGKAFWKHIQPYNQNLKCAPNFEQ